MKKRTHFVISLALLTLALVGFSFAQDGDPKQAVCTGNKVYVLAASDVEAKVKELNAEGYCISTSNFVSLGDGKVMLIVNKNELEDPPDECESGEKCE